MTTTMTIVGLAALTALVVTIGGLTRYAMELHRAAEGIVDATERVMFWRGLQTAIERGPRWRRALVQYVHRLIGGLTACPRR